MDIVDRILLLRKTLKLSQTEFGEKLNVSRSVIDNIERRKVPPKDLLINGIINAYNINPEWLKDGKGEMFATTEEQLIRMLQNAYNLDEVGVRIIRAYLELDDSDRQSVGKFLDKLTKK